MSHETTASLSPLTRAAMAGLNTPRTKTVELPDYGGTVVVRELRSSEATEFQKRTAQGVDKGVAYLLATATLSPDGSPLFDAADGEMIGNLPAKLSDAISRAVIELSFHQPTPVK